MPSSRLMITARALRAQFKAIRGHRRGASGCLVLVVFGLSCGCLGAGSRILFSQTLMKLPDVYTDWRIVAGFALIVLGTVNWVVGRARTQEYSRIAVGTDNAPADEAFLTGRALVLAGVVLMLFGFIVIIQRDNRHVHRRLHSTLGGNALPPRPH